jgi:hypothetical protein
MKLHCADDVIELLVRALAADQVPAVLMERTGAGWRIEFMRPAKDCPTVEALVVSGKVERR